MIAQRQLRGAPWLPDLYTKGVHQHQLQARNRAALLGIGGDPMRHFWTFCISGVVRTPVLSLQIFQQCLGIPEVGGVKAFCEPVIHLRQQLVGFLPPALALPQPTQAHGGTQSEGLHLPAPVVARLWPDTTPLPTSVRRFCSPIPGPQPAGQDKWTRGTNGFKLPRCSSQPWSPPRRRSASCWSQGALATVRTTRALLRRDVDA